MATAACAAAAVKSEVSTRREQNTYSSQMKLLYMFVRALFRQPRLSAQQIQTDYWQEAALIATAPDRQAQGIVDNICYSINSVMCLLAC
jgi:hypothetical protein